MPADGFQLIECATAAELWELLSPERPLGKSPNEFRPIFRGQSDASWPLEPSAFRPNGAVREKILGPQPTEDDQIAAEKKMLADFVEACDSLGLAIPGDGAKLRKTLGLRQMSTTDVLLSEEWPPEEVDGLLAAAQHHGIPTRLLDWTRRSYVAAYFAASGALVRKPSNSHFAIWVLDTTLIWEKGMSSDGVSHDSFPMIKLLVAPGAVSRNLAAQAGLFTLLRSRNLRSTPLLRHSLEAQLCHLRETLIWKIIVPTTEAAALLQLCRLHHITAATLFPGYDGAGMAVLDAVRSTRR